MTVLPFDKVRWSQDNDGVWLSLRTPSEYRAQVIQYANAFDPDKPHEAALKEKKKTRSLDANAYCWVLIGKIAAKLGSSPTEIYREFIRDLGDNYDTVCVQDKAVEAVCRGWEQNGLGWQTITTPSKLDGCTNVLLYYGSSTYDTATMSRLIDCVVAQAHDCGVETMTPRELDRLREDWK